MGSSQNRKNDYEVVLFGLLVFNGTFSTNRLYHARNIYCVWAGEKHIAT